MYVFNVSSETRIRCKLLFHSARTIRYKNNVTNEKLTFANTIIYNVYTTWVVFTVTFARTRLACARFSVNRSSVFP